MVCSVFEIVQTYLTETHGPAISIDTSRCALDLIIRQILPFEERMGKDLWLLLFADILPFVVRQRNELCPQSHCVSLSRVLLLYMSPPALLSFCQHLSQICPLSGWCGPSNTFTALEQRGCGKEGWFATEIGLSWCWCPRFWHTSLSWKPQVGLGPRDVERLVQVLKPSIRNQSSVGPSRCKFPLHSHLG